MLLRFSQGRLKKCSCLNELFFLHPICTYTTTQHGILCFTHLYFQYILSMVSNLHFGDSSKSMFRKKEWKKACSNKRRPVPETSGRLLPPVLRLQNRHHRLLSVRWYFGEFPKQPTLIRERLESRGYMVNKLRELMLLGNLSPQQKIELDMVLETISRIVMSI